MNWQRSVRLRGRLGGCACIAQGNRVSSRTVRITWLWVACVALACGGSHAQAPTHAAAAANANQAVPQLPERPKNTLYRDEVEAAKAEGLGHFFQRLEIEPVGETDADGRLTSFQGFQIVALRPAVDWLAFDFAPGDVLTHINGVSVEHYSTWVDQFEALPKADQIRVDLLRAGEQKTIVVRIADRGPAAANRAAPAAKTPAPPAAAAK